MNSDKESLGEGGGFVDFNLNCFVHIYLEPWIYFLNAENNYGLILARN